MGRPEAKVFADDFSLYTLEVPELVYRSFRVSDTGGVLNAKLDPGEEAALTLVLGNAGGVVPATTARLVSLSSNLDVLDADGTFPAVGIGETTMTEADAFRVRAAVHAPVEIPAMCNLVLSGSGYDDTIPIPVLIGDSMNLPQGPDLYGYRIYDYTDSCYVERPDYEWVELRSLGSNLRVGNDETRALRLPVDFGSLRWYGVDYDSISICSNGWIAAGVTDRPDFVPIILPYGNSPANIIGVNWGDYDPATYGAVWHWHDTVNHRFIVEWDSVPYVGHTGDWERFQVHVYERTAGALTGDNIITMMYDVINYPGVNTTGFQNQTGSVGLTHTWKGWYPRVAAPLRSGSALRIIADVQGGVIEAVLPVRSPVPIPATIPSVVRAGEDVEVCPMTGDCSGLHVVDVTGRVVYQSRMEPRQARFRLSTRGWVSGVYYLIADDRLRARLLLVQ